MRWLLQNLGNRASFAVSHPTYTARALWREVTHADERFIASVTNSTPQKIRKYLNEPFEEPEFAARLSECEQIMAGLPLGGDFYGKRVLIQYTVVRALRPATIVETGVANGISTAYLLLALEKNAHGFLHSVELPSSTVVPADKSMGWVVLDRLRGRWKLHTGDVKELLAPLLQTVAPLDLFIHDSNHSAEHMYWELALAGPHVRSGGILVADDALSGGFARFADQCPECPAQIIRGVGIIRK